jgi:hypothetical protein
MKQIADATPPAARGKGIQTLISPIVTTMPPATTAAIKPTYIMTCYYFRIVYVPTYVPKKVACKIILGDAKNNIMR